MFDFSFGEMGLVAIVALLVLGPERLPKVARTAGALVRRARTSWQNVRDEIERELAAEDLKRSIDEVKQAAVDLRSDIASASAEMQSSAADVAVAAKAPDGVDPAGESHTIRPPSGTHDERH
ncbi:MAG: Sec-independent protein translocase protein TatB [Rudaea sp.]